MIERGHVHRLYPVSMTDRDDGSRVVHSRCNASPATPRNPAPGCTLEEQIVLRGGELLSLRYRVNGVWFAPLDLLRLLPLPVRECSSCEGEPILAPCEMCGGLGVEAADGGKVVAPDLHVRV